MLAACRADSWLSYRLIAEFKQKKQMCEVSVNHNVDVEPTALHAGWCIAGLGHLTWRICRRTGHHALPAGCEHCFLVPTAEDFGIEGQQLRLSSRQWVPKRRVLLDSTGVPRTPQPVALGAPLSCDTSVCRWRRKATRTCTCAWHLPLILCSMHCSLQLWMAATACWPNVHSDC
jgi:hypothetical protein